jgi:(R,R)-butanediol dehydrogenase / meso-butanediol dehydrogenase / diacetyl reductase
LRAAVTTEDGGFDVTTMPDPSPGPGELVVRVTASGICGSDIKARPFMPPGTVMGHELCGEVVAVGPGSGGHAEGTAVAVLPILSCGRCGPCQAGEVAHCPAARFLGMGGSRGGFAELAVVAAAHAFALPAGLPPLHGALVEPFAVGLHAAAAGEVRSGDDVLIFGAGAVGLTVAAWARDRGAEQVTVIDPDPARLALAQVMGATSVLAAAAEVPPGGHHVVFECVGHPGLLDPCVSATAGRGRVVIAGVHEGPVKFENPAGALLKELTIRFSVAYRPGDFRAVVDAFGAGSIDPAPLIGPLVGIDHLGEAFAMVKTGATGGRVLVSPEELHEG